MCLCLIHDIVDWADEEGARYGYSCLGSSAASGSVNISEFTNRVDNEGIPFKMAISKHGLNIDTFTDAHKTFQVCGLSTKVYIITFNTSCTINSSNIFIALFKYWTLFNMKF